jgi:hypothetical protein
VEEFRLADIAFNIFPASVDRIWEMLSVLMNLNDTLGGMVCCWILALRIFA